MLSAFAVTYLWMTLYLSIDSGQSVGLDYLSYNERQLYDNLMGLSSLASSYPEIKDQATDLVYSYFDNSPNQREAGITYPSSLSDSQYGNMADAARMLTSYSQSSGYGFPASATGYGHAQSYEQAHKHQSYDTTGHQPTYHQQQQHQSTYSQPQVVHSGYAKKQKVKKVFVPIVVRKKKEKKQKIISMFKGFYIPGGTQIFGKFKKLKDCQKACAITPTCFAADYNPWLKKCYIHTNFTACEEMSTHPKLIHFKKIPCDLVETPRGVITLGVQIFGGLVQKGIKSLQECIKKCATAGGGIAANHVPENFALQVCFAIDYDFGSHKCYFHTNSDLCPANTILGTPVQTVAAPSVINILICPVSSVTT